MSAQIQAGGLREKLAALAPVIEGLSRYSALDGGVDIVEGAERFMRELAALIRQHIEQLFATSVASGEYLDRGDEWSHTLEASYRRIEDNLSRWQSVRPLRGAAARAAYDRYLDAVVEFAEAAKELHAALLTHDLAAKPQPA